MKLKFTPGPWFARPAIRSGEFNITAQSGGFAPLAKVKGDKRGTIADALHNARLMAAAPDLFAALLAMIEHCPDLEKNDQIVNAVKLARDAIERAA